MQLASSEEQTDQVAEAAQCLHEASSIFPMSHHIIFMKGLLHEKKNEFHEAQTCYQNALAINPYHLKSLRHLPQPATRRRRGVACVVVAVFLSEIVVVTGCSRLLREDVS
ncbi:Tetratricopeptide repeat protein 7B [Chionoecetes opilio]|uniref:Tetratricopeptide repeat protein 7B n=1 Tax=Chionoecetes opilio TaxID=41210 RepID=A0A8J4YPU7_CHIOP|nr:Tetratricopeptide repeat protein 7B [Chionoecetes opilio]